MTERIATTPGVYPLPDWAKDDLADLKGHQKHDLIDGDEGDDVVSVYDQAREEVVERQQDAGLDRVVEGQLRWDDMLAHPFAVHDAVETHGIVRYYDNNNFYRDPVVTGELTFDGDIAAELEAASEFADSGSLQAVVPGPYSLADLATDEYYGDDADFLAAVAEFLAGEVEAFPEVETLFVLEPSLVENPPGEGDDERASEAIDTVADAAPAGTDVIVHTYWGALEEKVHAHLLDADFHAVGYDFVSEQEQNLYNINEYGTKDSIAAGVVDGQNTLVEDSEAIAERADWLEESTPAADFEEIYLTPNTELFYLPYSTFQEKLAALGEATELAEVKA
ncbi:5-methyltetrahydropteroyltriglutamate--homocysteine methyltransferase [Halorussus amylolyticus]|uniref:5-methyltetrahydropteroyltriglutamate-- homocysteine methyltransferase n=1 Tax=Halorussus amylolyticus TaxID=1126242 RepID=UPI00104B9CE5|nr:5-methyltetrahydropteroyltriglutamate--homocysteine methyltransferase [Halorussus amylolyticus]